MEEKQKVKVVFEFDRKDYDNVLFLLGTTNGDKDEIEKTWDTMVSEEVLLRSDSFASLRVTPAEMLTMFVSFAIASVEDKVKSK